MTGLGGSRPIQQRWQYVQDEQPTDRREGVRWIDTSGDDPVTRVFSVDYDEWMREVRLWVQDSEPGPRVGPIDGDRWVDTSQEKRPTLVYSTQVGDWVNPVDVSWGEVSERPTSTEINHMSAGGWTTKDEGVSYDSGTNTGSVSLSADDMAPFDEWTVELRYPTHSNFEMNWVEVYIDGNRLYRDNSPNAPYTDSGYVDEFATTIRMDFNYTSEYGYSEGFTIEGFSPASPPHSHQIPQQ